MFGKLNELAGKVGGSGMANEMEPRIRQFLAENWPAIASSIKQQLGTAAIQALQDDKLVGQAGKIAYGFVPGMVRMALPEQTFINYITENRAKVLEWVSGVATK